MSDFQTTEQKINSAREGFRRIQGANSNGVSWDNCGM